MEQRGDERRTKFNLVSLQIDRFQPFKQYANSVWG
jgi:hypothetical protein